MRQIYPGCEIVPVLSQDIWDQPADIVSPCSTQEKIIDLSVIDRMGASGVKVVLAGANNPLEDPNIADYALQQHGIAILPEVVSNNGSAISAGMEPRLLYEVDRGNYLTKEECVRSVLIPQITTTARSDIENLLQAYAIANDGKNRSERTSLYQVGRKVFK